MAESETAKRILGEKKLFIFDMDGTIYLGEKTFTYAVRFMEHLRASGRRILFFTNNASRSTRYYQAKLCRMGFSPREGEVLTAGDVTAGFLTRKRAGKRVYLVGTPDLYHSFRRAGVLLAGDENGVLADGESADIVVSSFDTTLTYEKLNNACRLIRGGTEYLSTHPDFNCPTEDGFIPDSGAIAAAITASTGKTPTYFGKPYPETAETISAMTDTSPDGMCVFGDRLYTDIALGRRYGITSVLVLTGETQPDDLASADEKDRPDFIFPSLDEVDRLMFPEA